MGRVGYEAPPHLLRGLKTVGQLVELLGQLRHLIVSAGIHPVAVFTLTHPADGAQQQRGVAGQRLGQHQRQNNSHRADHHGDIAQIGLDGDQQFRLLGIVFIEVNRTQRHTAVDHRHRRAGSESVFPVFGAKLVVPLQGAQHLIHQRVVAFSVVQCGAVIQNTGRGIGDQHTGHLHILQQSHSLRHTLFRQRFGYRNGAADGQRLPLQAGLLGGKHHVLHLQHRIGVEDQKNGRHHQNVSQGIFRLNTAKKGHFTPAAPLMVFSRHGVTSFRSSCIAQGLLI